MGCLLELIYNLTVRVIFGRFLHMRPKIRVVGGVLIASTHPRWAFLTLGLKLRKVMVDPRRRAVRIFARYGWIFSVTRHVPFDAVLRVVYDYRDVNPLQHLPLAVYQELDLFTVSLDLRSGERLVLCRFFGPGEFVNEHFLPDWVFWDEQLAVALTRGSQESESRAYASAVAAAIGVPLGQG